MLRAVSDHATLTIVSAWLAWCELYQGHVQAAVAVLDEAERTQTWYLAAAAHTEIGIRTGDREHLERGARMFAEMGVDTAALWPGAGQGAQPG
jgi:hypothetical protein